MAKFEGRVIHGRLKFGNSAPRWWHPQGLEKEIFGMVWNFSLLAQVALCPGIPTVISTIPSASLPSTGSPFKATVIFKVLLAC